VLHRAGAGRRRNGEDKGHLPQAQPKGKNQNALKTIETKPAHMEVCMLVEAVFHFMLSLST
jgi:elongation factor P hydroxylase